MQEVRDVLPPKTAIPYLILSVLCAQVIAFALLTWLFAENWIYL
jgi:hypothetical protein